MYFSGNEMDKLQDEKRKSSQLEGELIHAQTQLEQLKKELQNKHQELSIKNLELEAKNDAIQAKEEELRAKNLELEAKNVEIQAKVNVIRRQDHQLADLQHKMAEAAASEDHTWIKSSASSDKSWIVPRLQIQNLAKHEIGRGAWGVVYSSTFRGEPVAIKQAHRDLLHGTTIDMLKREVMIMAEIQHPNLVRFVAAVLDNAVHRGTDTPIIVSELMDMNLRAAYREINLSPSLLSILRDVAYALHYLHQYRTPIIHRDVSAPNVLLKKLQNGSLRAKVSDFGSANLAKQAQTAASGAIVYCAPEMFPTEDITTPPKPQTTKVDVFSYGILVLEVIAREMPSPETRYALLQRVSRQWKVMHEMIVECTKREPAERPTIADILNKLNRLPQ